MVPRRFILFSCCRRLGMGAGTAVAVLLAVHLGAQTTLPNNSPFLPPNAPAAAAANGETLEFAGVSTIGKKTDLIIYDKAAKKSRWIPLGETVGGITAVKYDPRAETAVIRANGVEKNLRLRKGTGPINAPVPASAPPVAMPAPAPAPTGGEAVTLQAAPNPPATMPGTPEAIAKQEVEARMLVSDLLEIGMAQRKAYEEAHRKAAEGNASGAPAQPASPADPAATSTPAPENPAPAAPAN